MALLYVSILAQCVFFNHIAHTDTYLARISIYIFITFCYFCSNVISQLIKKDTRNQLSTNKALLLY